MLMDLNFSFKYACGRAREFKILCTSAVVMFRNEWDHSQVRFMWRQLLEIWYILGFLRSRNSSHSNGPFTPAIFPTIAWTWTNRSVMGDTVLCNSYLLFSRPELLREFFCIVIVIVYVNSSRNSSRLKMPSVNWPLQEWMHTINKIQPFTQW